MDFIMTNIFNEINNLSLFSQEEKNNLISRIKTKEIKGKEQNYIECLVRKKEIVLTPEETVRQLYLARLINDYGYEISRIKLEHAIHFGREVKRADIVIFEKERPTTEYIVVELKKDKEKEGKEQLKSYCNATGASIAIWTNGSQISYYNRKDPNYFEEITEIPTSSQTLKDILDEKFTLKDLIIKDKILKEGKTLKQIILDMEDEVLANAGVDVFEECFKLIFTKLYDEKLSNDDKLKINWKIEELAGDELNDLEYSKYLELVKQVDDCRFRCLEFRNKGETDLELKKRIQDLFDKAKRQWKGVFSDDAKINLAPSHLSVCVSSIQDIKLFNSNLQVIDEAFEYLVSKSAKGEKGQYFTPRHVIDMCVKMLNPKAGEHMIDTASGSCGFPVHTIFKITGKLFSNTDIPAEQKENILKIFGIDFDEKVVRVSRTLNLIAGDGNTNVLHLNTLDYDRWVENTKSIEWNRVYGEGFERLKELGVTRGNNKEFKFELLMANPPFAGDIKETRILTKYDLAFRRDQGRLGSHEFQLRPLHPHDRSPARSRRQQDVQAVLRSGRHLQGLLRGLVLQALRVLLHRDADHGRQVSRLRRSRSTSARGSVFLQDEQVRRPSDLAHRKPSRLHSAGVPQEGNAQQFPQNRGRTSGSLRFPLHLYMGSEDL